MKNFNKNKYTMIIYQNIDLIIQLLKKLYLLKVRSIKSKMFKLIL